MLLTVGVEELTKQQRWQQYSDCTSYLRVNISNLLNSPLEIYMKFMSIGFPDIVLLRYAWLSMMAASIELGERRGAYRQLCVQAHAAQIEFLKVVCCDLFFVR